MRAILISHGHADHFNGAQMLHALSGAPVWISAADQVFCQQHPIPDLPGIPFPIHHHYEDGGAISLGRFCIRTRFTPSHTPGPHLSSSPTLMKTQGRPFT
ncbi:MBL fold metallo-hydrolase [Flintibacter sp.]|uniref:MBL fold metallo-hydrolase n=1 Tax=Flintibacter sp. TaxID=1918624 RepID=UPI0034A0BB36